MTGNLRGRQDATAQSRLSWRPALGRTVPENDLSKRDLNGHVTHGRALRPPQGWPNLEEERNPFLSSPWHPLKFQPFARTPRTFPLADPALSTTHMPSRKRRGHADANLVLSQSSSFGEGKLTPGRESVYGVKPYRPAGRMGHAMFHLHSSDAWKGLFSAANGIAWRRGRCSPCQREP